MLEMNLGQAARLENHSLQILQPDRRSYPSLTIPIPNELPIEIVVTGMLPPGAGSREIERSHALQLAHPTYTNQFFEASSKILNTDYRNNREQTAVYTFLVGREDLEFHRHEGHRVIIGTTGSGGAYFRFSYATAAEEQSDPKNFVEKMHLIKMPPDVRFVLRFSGRVYHQFGPCDRQFDTMFAISVHTDESGGLSGEVLNEVLQDRGSIPLLTEPISAATAQYLKSIDPHVTKLAGFWDLTSTDDQLDQLQFPPAIAA